MNSNPASQVDQAFIYIIVFSFALLLLITAAMIYFVIKYRRSKNPDPSDIRGNWILETLWTVIPTAIALSMFYIGWNAYMGLRNVPPGAIEIDVYAQQYSWIFVYPNDKETENEMVVPVNKPIKLNITSEDVIHSLFIPAFRIKMDAVKGLTTYAWFMPDKPGQYYVQCTEYCGVSHADMTAVLRIVPEEEYQKWLETDEDEDE